MRALWSLLRVSVYAALWVPEYVSLRLDDRRRARKLAKPWR